MAQAVRVKGLRDFQRACALAPKDTRREVKRELAAVGEAVEAEARQLFAPIDARSAAGFRTVVRQRGVAVEQTKRRTTGQHPEFGAMQMRTLLQARESKRGETERGMEEAIDRVADLFEKR